MSELKLNPDALGDLYEALDNCPLPSTMGTAQEHYERFYDWQRQIVAPALARARGDATTTVQGRVGG